MASTPVRYEADLIAEFDTYLPEMPPWKSAPWKSTEKNAAKKS